MVLINKAINEITVKLVYYGPGLCGKTTNLEKIYGNPKLDNKGKMISMATETDRTLFFDFMPMELGTIGGQKVRVQLYTVPGQVFYDATRKLVLRGADGVVFVADSQSSMRSSNLESLENLKTNLRLNRIDPDKVALVLQYNKRDLPNVDSVEEMNAYLNSGNAPIVEAAAKNGTGVTATLRAAVAKMLENLKNNVDTTLYEEPQLARPDMTAKSGVTSMSAGTPKLSMKTGATPAAAPSPAPASAPTLPPSPAPAPAREAAGPAAMAAPSFAAAASFPSSSPFEASVAVAEDEDPFGAMHIEPAIEEEESHDSPFGVAAAIPDITEGEPEHQDNPFSTATEIHDRSEERAEVEALLASARGITAALEEALTKAREHESALQRRLTAL
jgi:signal recognition particle receptor subunit beta